jgi:rhamnose transport system permease protein
MKKITISRETILSIVIISLILIISTRFPAFIEISNLLSVFNDSSPLMILAIAQMIVILTRCIDLSVAAILALTGMICAMVNVAFPELPIVFIILISILTGLFLGAINGFFVWIIKIPPIVVTLGTMTIYRGLIFVISEGKWVNAHEMSDAFKAFPREQFLFLPMLSWMAIIVIILFYILLSRFPLGRSFYAIGGNPHAAVYAGLNVGKIQFLAFVLSGGLSGLVGYLWVSRYSVAYVDIAIGFELDVVAACVIGGISIMGGVGSLIGAIQGALFIGVIKNALPVINISPFWQMAISGSAIVIAIILNAKSTSRKGRNILKKEK